MVVMCTKIIDIAERDGMIMDNNIPGFKEYLDLNHRYYIVIALKKEQENSVYDCHFFDEKGDIKEGFDGFWFDEKLYLLLENYLFFPINKECDLIINMYEEEYAEPDILPHILEITDRMINNCDNEEVLEPAKEFRKLVEKAIELDTVVGFCF